MLLALAIFRDDIIDFQSNFGNTVLSITTEPFIFSESITTSLKAIELFLRNIKKPWRHYHSFSADVGIFS